MANWLSQLLGVTTHKIKVIERDRSSLRLQEWQSQPHLVAMAQHFLTDPRFKLMLDCAEVEHPGKQVLVNAPYDQRAAEQLRGEGYTMALANLAAMGRMEKPRERLEPTFEPPEEPTE